LELFRGREIEYDLAVRRCHARYVMAVAASRQRPADNFKMGLSSILLRHDPSEFTLGIMPSWNITPGNRLLTDVSLWSADLGNLQRAVEGLSPYADSFHLDVADAHFAGDLLFFPDLVAALRPHTDRPFHVHLMLEQPAKMVDRFIEAGANLITVHCELGEAEIRRALGRIRVLGAAAGMAVRLETPLEAVAGYVDSLDAVVLLGTELGVKGKDLSPEACHRIAELSSLLERLSLRDRVVIIADGGIRRDTVPRLREAGADAIVPGSLVFQAGDPANIFSWIHSVGVRS
jgi:ribulose-phosphate 3-epimerase